MQQYATRLEATQEMTGDRLLVPVKSQQPSFERDPTLDHPWAKVWCLDDSDDNMDCHAIAILTQHLNKMNFWTLPAAGYHHIKGKISIRHTQTTKQICAYQTATLANRALSAMFANHKALKLNKHPGSTISAFISFSVEIHWVLDNVGLWSPLRISQHTFQPRVQLDEDTRGVLHMMNAANHEQQGARLMLVSRS